MKVKEYWSNLVENYKSSSEFKKYIVLFYVKDLAEEFKFGEFFSFDEKKQVAKFLKEVVLPSLVYKTTGFFNKDYKFVIKDYKDVLNFIMANDIKDDKELIKRYSFFYNSLEEFEYEDSNYSESSLITVVEKMNSYFNSKETEERVVVKVYTDTDEII